MRNAELFDATCQFRDAGHPLEETEGQLLARALADGLSESEARTTIRSAFARTSREPLGVSPQAVHRRPAMAPDARRGGGTTGKALRMYGGMGDAAGVGGAAVG